MGPDELIQQMMEEGERSWDIEDRPVMFPREPRPMEWFFPKYKENLIKRENMMYQQLLVYEGEVKVYRALEKLNESLTVLQGFQYTHQQYGLFVPDHLCRSKSDNACEGVSDFLLVHDKFVAVLQVKAQDYSRYNEQRLEAVFKRNYKDAKHQMAKTCSLINGMCKKLPCKGVTILKFTVFSAIERRSAELIGTYAALSDVEKKNILFQDDLEDLEKLTQKFQPRNLEDVNVIHSQLKYVLLGLYSAQGTIRCTRNPLLGHMAMDAAKDADDLIELLKQEGERMTQNYCSIQERSIMIPDLAPLPKWIDKLPEEMENLTNMKKVVVKQQLEYTSGVKVYRALEKLKVSLIVLQRFRYTDQHYDYYELFVPDHTRTCDSENESEGKCDFLLVHDKFVAVLEVKIPDFSEGNQGTVFERNYEDAKKDNERTCLLIDGMCAHEKLGCEGVTILQFTVFSTIERGSAEEISEYAELPDVEKENILFQDDLEDLEKLAGRLQPRNLEDVNNIPLKLKYVLLGLWGIDCDNMDNW